jgi:2'-5' RNA ligase
MEKIRAFLALNTSIEAQSEIFELRKNLSDLKSDVKWEPKDKFHITLKFLGDVERPLLMNLAEDLKYELKGFGSFNVTYNTLGCFPNMRLPRVLWIGASDEELKIAGLNKIIEAKTKSYNFESETNRFHPHITLGRVKGNSGIDEVTEIMKRLHFEAIKDTASEVYIVQSTLQRGGSVYNVIDKIIL